jgi:hypothetical protein
LPQLWVAKIYLLLKLDSKLVLKIEPEFKIGSKTHDKVAFFTGFRSGLKPKLT